MAGLHNGNQVQFANLTGLVLLCSVHTRSELSMVRLLISSASMHTRHVQCISKDAIGVSCRHLILPDSIPWVPIHVPKVKVGVRVYKP